MKQEDYLQGEVAEFTKWLAQRLCGLPINFPALGDNQAYPTLSNALSNYFWPSMTTGGERDPDVPPPAHSNLAINAALLDVLQKALRSAYKGGPSKGYELSGTVAAILHWGGVYKGGNEAWLKENHPQLLSILEKVVSDHAQGDDESQVVGLRFNAGMTKVYSLLIDNFIIYDSRVAASLAWLALNWWISVEGLQGSQLPPRLRFACPPARNGASAHRNPDKKVFKTTSSSYEHYMWNVRANWILADAQKEAGEKSLFNSLREIEAALFQMGERVI